MVDFGFYFGGGPSYFGIETSFLVGQGLYQRILFESTGGEAAVVKGCLLTCLLVPPRQALPSVPRLELSYLLYYLFAAIAPISTSFLCTLAVLLSCIQPGS